MVQGQIFLKGGGGRYLYLEITLTFAKLCYAFEKKNFFLPPS